MSKIPSVHRGEPGARRGQGAGGGGSGVRGREGEMKKGTRTFRGGEGQGAERVWASSLATGGTWSQDEGGLGPGFPLKIDPNRDKAGMRTACWSPRRCWQQH